ncbi:unnamed protein product [Nezara viridula]|uniref:Uncharacterized protein n=1 Tax=Nezara viridula TaxID=85310 RepID=A0A9P0E7Q2_NEZVI|nr:unnamed protein product [Nezara viridula]
MGPYREPLLLLPVRLRNTGCSVPVPVTAGPYAPPFRCHSWALSVLHCSTVPLSLLGLIGTPLLHRSAVTVGPYLVLHCSTVPLSLLGLIGTPLIHRSSVTVGPYRYSIAPLFRCHCWALSVLHCSTVPLSLLGLIGTALLHCSVVTVGPYRYSTAPPFRCHSWAFPVL